MTVTTLGEQIRVYDEFNRLTASYIFIEAKERLETGQLLTWRKMKFKAKPTGKYQKPHAVAITNIEKGQRDLVKTYGAVSIKVAK